LFPGKERTVRNLQDGRVKASSGGRQAGLDRCGKKLEEAGDLSIRVYGVFEKVVSQREDAKDCGSAQTVPTELNSPYSLQLSLLSIGPENL
jgi:hypothetical protein